MPPRSRTHVRDRDPKRRRQNAVGRSPVDGKGVRTIQDGTMRPCEPSPFETDHRPTADAFSLADRRDDVVTADSRSCKGSSHATGHCMNGGG